MAKEKKISDQLRTLLLDPEKNQEVITRLLATCTPKQRVALLPKPERESDYSCEFKGELVYEQIQINDIFYYKDSKGAIVNNNNKLVGVIHDGEIFFFDDNE